MNRKHDKKDIETQALAAARSAGVPIPPGEILGESPDFTFNERTLGIDVCELLRPANSNRGIKPVEEENYHQEILRIAHEDYYSDPDAKPARIILYFERSTARKRDIAHELAEFVRANVHRARPRAEFGPDGLPEGFVAINIEAEIEAESGSWHTAESGNVTLQDIRDSLRAAIREKNKHVPAYRRNLAPGAQVWLLLYSTTPISRGIMSGNSISILTGFLGLFSWKANSLKFTVGGTRESRITVRRDSALSIALVLGGWRDAGPAVRLCRVLPQRDARRLPQAHESHGVPRLDQSLHANADPALAVVAGSNAFVGPVSKLLSPRHQFGWCVISRM